MLTNLTNMYSKTIYFLIKITHTHKNITYSTCNSAKVYAQLLYEVF